MGEPNIQFSEYMLAERDGHPALQEFKATEAYKKNSISLTPEDPNQLWLKFLAQRKEDEQVYSFYNQMNRDRPGRGQTLLVAGDEGGITRSVSLLNPARPSGIVPR